MAPTTRRKHRAHNNLAGRKRGEIVPCHSLASDEGFAQGNNDARPPAAVSASASVASPASSRTRVDGKGLWRSWKRNFQHKLRALLDLIDNALDASLATPDAAGTAGASPREFVGRVHIYPDQVARSATTAAAAAKNERAHPAPDPAHSAPAAVRSAPPEADARMDTEVDVLASTINTGLCIVNNSIRPIRPLAHVLEVYNSSKTHSGAGDIGENGVGLKQGCATLSDLSFVLVKNGQDGFVELGIVAESLQRAEGCYLPAFRFTLSNEGDALQSLKDQMTALFSRTEHCNVAQCIARYGSAVEGAHASDTDKGIDRLLQHFDGLCHFFDHAFVFALVLDDISYGDAVAQRRRAETDPIKDLREAIPRTYLHVPPSFDFRVVNSRAGRERVTFHYWPQRLVEFSSFAVPVHETVPWRQLPASGRLDSTGPPRQPGTYRLRVLLGFDRVRVNAETERKAAALYVYSRASGRLIKCEPDARFLLRLDSTGTIFCQGLTILIDDVEGRLPLNPTKQDVAFGEQAHGEVHKENLFAWVSAVAKFFYTYHLARFDRKRTRLTAKLKEFGAAPVQAPLKDIDSSRFTTFAATFKQWARTSIRIDPHLVRENIGPDTHFHLVSPRPPPAVAAALPRSTAVKGTEPASKKRKLEDLQAPQSHQDDAQPLQLRCALQKHRCDTQRLLKTSRACGEATIPADKMTETRSANLALLRSANLPFHNGITLSTEQDLLARLTAVESEAAQMYRVELQKTTQSRRANVRNGAAAGTGPNPAPPIDQGTPGNYPSHALLQHHPPQHSQRTDQDPPQCTNRNNHHTQSDSQQQPLHSANPHQHGQQPLHSEDVMGTNTHVQQTHKMQHPDTNGVVAKGRPQQTHKVKPESDAISNEVIDLVDDEDEESVGLSAYMVNGEPPRQPQGGWQPAKTTSEHGQFLIQLIRMGKVKREDTLGSIWKRYTSLRVVNPGKSFGEFVHSCRTEATRVYPDCVPANGANDDEESDEGTDYQQLCQALSLKLEERRNTDHQRKKEIRYLKKEIVALKKEVERQNTLLSQVRHR